MESDCAALWVLEAVNDNGRSPSGWLTRAAAMTTHRRLSLPVSKLIASHCILIKGSSPGSMTADHKGAELVSNRGTACRFVGAVMDEIITWRPDLVVCGFVPPVGIAAQILRVPWVVYCLPNSRNAVRRHTEKVSGVGVASESLTAIMPDMYMKSPARLAGAKCQTSYAK